MQTLLFLRGFRVLLWSGLVLSVFAASSRAAGYLVYVSNELSGDISVVDPETRQVIQHYQAGKRPRGIAVSADGRKLFIAVSGSPRMGPGADRSRADAPASDKAADGIVVLDAQTGRLEVKLDVGSDPEEFALGADGKRVFVANEDSGEFSAWDVATGRKVFSHSVSEEPEGVAVSPNGREAWVGCEAGGDIFMFDAETGTQVGHALVGKRPRSIAFAPDGRRAYVALEGEAAVAVVDAVSHQLLRKIEIPGASVLPMGIAVSADGKLACVTTGRGGHVAFLDLENGRTSESVEVRRRPWGIELSPDGKFAFTANGPSNDISVIDLASRKEVARITAGTGPWGIAVGVKP